MRRSPILVTVLIAAAAAAGPARADFFTGEQVDVGGNDLVRVGDVDVARDGTGAVTYVKKDGGVDHIFVSRLVDGAFQPPERIDAALAEPGSQPVVSAVDGGRLVVAFVSAGRLFAVLKPDGTTPWGGLQQLATPASNPSVDMSIHGTAYLSFTAPGASAADVRVARLDRTATTWSVLPDPLDIDPARDAGDGNGRSKIAVSADGTAVVVWGEGGHVYGRRVFEDHLSSAPQDLNVDQIDGHAGGVADLPDIDIEDDSSFAWAAFRQQFDDGRFHTVTKRLIGSQFEQAGISDGLGFGGDQSVSPFVELNGRGEGIVATGSGAGGAFVGIIHDDQVFDPQLLNAGSSVPSQPVGGMAENNDAYAAWLAGSGPGDTLLHMNTYDIDPAKRFAPPPGPDHTISDPAAGPVDGAAGMDMAVDRTGNAMAVFIQGAGDGRRLMAAGYDRPPGTFRTYTSAKWRNAAKSGLSWGPALDIWGPLTYRIEVDGKPYGETKATKMVPTTPIPDGQHQWRVVAIDRRGQQTASPARTLRTDATPPKVSFTLKGSRQAGKPARVVVKANDVLAPGASGIAVVRVDYGDGFKTTGRKTSHRYGRRGSYTIRVSATDRAGNAVAVTRKIRVKKA